MSLSTSGVVYKPVNPFWLAKLAAEMVSGLYDFLIFSSVFMGLTAMAMVYTSCIIQHIPLSAPDLLIGFLIPFSVYNLNRKTDEKEDLVNRRDRYLFTKQFGKALFIAAILAYIIAMGIAVTFGLSMIILVSLPLICGSLYSIPVLPRAFRYHRLKEIPLVKNFIVGFVWAFLTAFLPVSTISIIPGFMAWICLIFFFSYVFIGSIIPDVRDMEGDALAGVNTIPVLIGSKKTNHLLLGINSFVGVGVIFLCLGHTQFPVVLIITGGFLYTQCCIYFFHSSRMKNFITDFLFDGQYILFGIVLGTLLRLNLLS